jgi:DNA replication protein DnaC
LQLIASRYEIGSILVTSNLPFGRWGETVSDDDDDDDVVAAAMIDRLVHQADVLTLTGGSYRTAPDVNCPQRTARTAEGLLRVEFAVAATT